MKICTACAARYDGPDWTCPECGTRPATRNGIVALAAEPRDDHADYPAAVYDALGWAEARHAWFSARNRLLVWAIGHYFPATASYLEIGCGTGAVFAAMRQAFPGWTMTALDNLPTGLERARQRVPDAQFLQVDARLLPFDREFDLAGAFDVLEHVDDDEQVLAQLHRALKPGGSLALTVPQHPWLWSRFDEMARHKRRYTRRELEAKVARAGFEVVRATSFVSLLLPAVWISRAWMKPAREEIDPLAELRVGRVMNLALAAVLAVERVSIRIGVSFSAGASLLLLGRRPATETTDPLP